MDNIQPIMGKYQLCKNELGKPTQSNDCKPTQSIDCKPTQSIDCKPTSNSCPNSNVERCKRRIRYLQMKYH